MADNKITIAELKKEVALFRDERDWKKFHTPKELAISISREASELLEVFQWKEVDLKDPKKLAKVREELADVIVNTLNFSDVTDIDLSEVVLEKLARNREKYPVEKAKGKAGKYNEL